MSVPTPQAGPPRAGRFDLARAKAVFATELRTIVRDRRAFFTAVVLPVLLYPILFALTDWMESSSEESLVSTTHTVALDLDALGDEHARPLRAALEDEELFLELVDADPAALEATQADAPTPETVLLGDAKALAVALPADDPRADEERMPTLAIFYDRGNTGSNVAADRVRDAARDLALEVEDRRLLELLPRDPTELVATTRVDLAPAADTEGQKLGMLLPLIAVLVLVSSASFAALSAFAGERESGTLETLLVQPVPGLTIAAGKLAAITLVGCLALAGNVLSFLGSAALGLGDLPGFRGEALGAGALRLGLGMIVLAPSALFLCGMTAFVSARARSFREGQNLILPLTLVTALLAAPVMIDRVRLDALLALVPVLGGALGFRDALAGTLTPGLGALAFAASALWTVWIARRVGGLLDAERLLRTAAVASETAARRLQSRRALAWGAAAVLVVYVVGGLLQAAHLELGLAATLWILALGMGLLAVRGTAERAGESIGQALWIRAPHPAHALGALCLAPGLAHGALWLAEQQSRLLPIPQMQGDLVDSLGSLSPLVAFLLFALSPGLCEEVLFRGAVLSGLRRDLGPARVIGWQALLFGAVHASIYRFVPTAILGAILAALTLRARSLWPAILLHTAYNGFLVTGWAGDPPAWLRAGPAAGIAVAGLALFTLRPPRD